jgi:hypothetical protein
MHTLVVINSLKWYKARGNGYFRCRYGFVYCIPRLNKPFMPLIIYSRYFYPQNECPACPKSRRLFLIQQTLAATTGAIVGRTYARLAKGWRSCQKGKAGFWEKTNAMPGYFGLFPFAMLSITWVMRSILISSVLAA